MADTISRAGFDTVEENPRRCGWGAEPVEPRSGA